MGDLRIHEGAHDVDDRVDVADVAEEAIAQPLSMVRPADEAGDVDELDVLGNAPFDPERHAELVEPRVGNGDDGDVRLDRRERILGSLGVRACERVEERGLAGVRKPDDANLHFGPTAPTNAPASASEG